MDAKHWKWILTIVILLGAFFAPVVVPQFSNVAYAWHGAMDGSADCTYAYVEMNAEPPEQVTVHTIDGVETWNSQHEWQGEETEYTFHGHIEWSTGETWDGSFTDQRPLCSTETPEPSPTPTETTVPPTSTPTSTTVPPTPTETEITSWNFEWSVGINCVQPWLRVHNLNEETVVVTGTIWAEDLIIAQVPEPYQQCPYDAWCGPEGDMPLNFVGTLSAKVSVKYEGQEVSYNSFSEELNCTQPTPTATATVQPSPTPTGTLVPSPTTTQPPETPIPGTPVPLPNTGVEAKDVLFPLGAFATFVLLVIAGFLAIVFRRR